jgi:queuosine precursor transporter
MYFILIPLYVATIPLANCMILHVGTVCDPLGACLIPVFPGILAPSGVVVIGAALLLRDLVQRLYGKMVSVVCILIGAAVAFGLAPPTLAIASAASFLLSEMVDFVVYTPLAGRYFVLALLLSCTAGALVDSGLFLTLAFGNLEHLLGQFIGKVYAVLAYAIVSTLARRYVLKPLESVR